VNVKYKTKNNNTDPGVVFFAGINHIMAKTISKRNLALMAKRLCIVWLSGSLFCPLKKMTRVENEIDAKTNMIMARSTRDILINPAATKPYPVINIRTDKYRREIYLENPVNAI
jgi:hypothetical protein